MLILNTLKFYYKFKNEKVPEYFKKFEIKTQDEKHGRNTRYKSLISTNVTRLRLSDKSLKNNLPIVLNMTPQIALDKTATHCFTGFVNYIKNMIINSYSNICNIQNCYVCNDHRWRYSYLSFLNRFFPNLFFFSFYSFYVFFSCFLFLFFFKTDLSQY